MGIDGVAGSFTPEVEKLIGLKLRERGFVGDQKKSDILYGSTDQEQALSRAKGNSEEFLKVLDPQEGAIVTWMPSEPDILLGFRRHAREMHERGVSRYKQIHIGTIVHDIAGDMDVMETYLHLGRQKRVIGAMIDDFLDKAEIRQHVVVESGDYVDALSGHEGEIWISGPCLVTDFRHPDPVTTPAPRR